MQPGENLKAALRSLGGAIREGRKDMKLSQEAFAERAGLSANYVGCIERGEKNISFQNIARVARALKLKPSWLLDRAGM